jgi:hypothetical protein
MSKIKGFALLFFSALNMFSCSNVERVDTKAMKKYMSDYKIKKIKQEDIMAQVEKLGESVSQPVLETLIKDIKNDEKNCETAFLNAQKLVQTQIKGNLKIVSLDDVTKENNYLPKEQQVLEAYQYSFEKNTQFEKNIQIINDTSYLFTLPIPKSSKIAKTCFQSDPLEYGVLSIKMSKNKVIQSLYQ